ncbi:DUF7695 domain-containing protein [Paenibacillus dendritiformis]
MCPFLTLLLDLQRCKCGAIFVDGGHKY